MKRKIQRIKNRIIAYGVITAILMAEVVPVGYISYAGETTQVISDTEQDETGETEETEETDGMVSENSVTVLPEEEVYEDLEIKNGYTLTSDMTVGNLTMLYGCTLNLNGYSLIVTGDTYISNGVIDFNNGELICKGDFDVRNGSGIYMDNVNDYLYVEKDTYIYCNTTITNGVIELKGNFTATERFKTQQNNKTIFSGQSGQVVKLPEGGCFADVEIQNYSEDGIYIEYVFKYNNLITNDCNVRYSDLGGERGYRLTEDVTVDKIFYLIADTLDLNGHTMTINGDLVQGGGTIDINGGNLIIYGNYEVRTMTKQGEEIIYGASNGKLVMDDEDDYIFIQGDYVNSVGNYQCNTLKYGTMEIQGNISVVNNIKNGGLVCEKEHTIILSGKEEQNINICGYGNGAYSEYNSVANLQLKNTSEAGVRLEQPVYVKGYMAQNDVPVNGKIITGDDTVFEGNMYNGDIFLAGDVRGSLSVNGDVTVYGTQYIYGSLCVYGSVYGEYPVIYSTDSYMYIQEDLKCSRISLFKGTLEIKGNIDVSGSISSNPEHKTILSGEKLQTITNSENCSFGIIEITNTGTEGVYSDGLLSADKIITNGCRLRYEGVEGEFGWTLTEDIAYDGDFVLIGGELDLNGHTLTVNGSLIQMSGDINVNGGKLNVGEDYIMRNRRTENGTVTYSNCSAGLMMQNETDYILVNGDFVCETTKKEKIILTDGVFEVKGDFQIIGINRNNYFIGKDNHRFIFSGDSPQLLTFDCEMKMSEAEIKNNSEEGIKIDGNLCIENYLNDHDTVIDGCIQIYSDTQLEDRIFGADLYIPYRSSLYIREPLTVSGDVNNQGYMYVYDDFAADGDFTCYGDIRIYGKMTVKGDVKACNYGDIRLYQGEFDIYGDYICSPSCSTNLNSGILQIGGDAVIDGNYYSDGSEKIIFCGNSLQTVTVDPDIMLNTVELRNYSDEGIYCPNLFYKKQLIRNGCNIRYGDCEGEYGWTLTEDVTWDGDLIIIDDTLDLNGYTLTVTGDLVQMSGNVAINGGKLCVTGDYRLQSISSDGENETYGDCTARLVMDKPEDCICVYGDMVLSQTISNKSLITDGTIELKGNLDIQKDTFSMLGESMLVMSGDDVQKITMPSAYTELIITGFKYANTSDMPISISGKLSLYGTVDTGEGGFSDYVYVREGAVIADNYFKGNVYFLDYTVEQSEKPLVIDGNVRLYDTNNRYGKINLYGDMTVCGDFDAGYYSYVNFYGKTLTVKGNFSGSRIYMTRTDDYMYVDGNVNLYGGLGTEVSDGTIELTGDLAVTGSYNFTKNSKIIMSGTKQQTIRTDTGYNINILELKNNSSAGVYSENYFPCNELILNDTKFVIGSGDYKTGVKLTEDTVISGEYLLGYGTLDLNGYTLTIEGDLIHAGGLIDINGGTLNVNGSYHMRVRNVYNGSHKWSQSSGRLIMDNQSDTVNILKNMELEATSSACYRDITDGEIRLSGDINSYNNYTFLTYENNILILNGSEKQIINGTVCVNNLHLHNTEEVSLNKNVTVVSELDAVSSVTGSGNMYLYDLGNLCEKTYNGNLIIRENSNLCGNVMINGDLTINGEIHLDTYELTAKSMALNAAMYVEEGRVNCRNDLNVNYSNGSLNMTGENGYVCVGRDITFAGKNPGTLSAGTLEVRGNITNKNSTLTAGGTHKTILALRYTSTGREYIQTVSFANTADKLNTLILQKEPDGYVFSRDVETMANEVIRDIKTGGTPEPVEKISIVSNGVSSITISYTSPAGQDGILGYYIYRDGKKIGTTSAATYTDTGLDCNTEYTYEVYPYDAYKNTAESSPSVKTSTLADTECTGQHF